MTTLSLFDFLYVDRQKVASLYSQLTGGVVEAFESSKEVARESDNKRNYDFKVFKHFAGGVDHERSSERVSIKPHHALILELEQELRRNGFLLDLTGEPRSLRDDALRLLVKQTLCIKVRGRVVFEDYERMKKVSSDYPAVLAFVNKSLEASIRRSAEYLQAAASLDELQRDVKQVKDRNARAGQEARLKNAREELESTARGARLPQTDQWVLDGFHTWVNAFLPGICNLRLYREGSAPDEHFFGHLKREGLEGMDSSLLHFAYGSKPTEELTLPGVVTSVPSESEDGFNPLTEFDRDDLRDFESVEHGFRGLFRGFDGLEALVRTSRFPRVMLQPLTVYREVTSTVGRDHV